jgi:hypothetical protein
MNHSTSSHQNMNPMFRPWINQENEIIHSIPFHSIPFQSSDHSSQMTYDISYMTYDIWHMIHDIWHMTYGRWHLCLMIWYDMIWYDMIWHDMTRIVMCDVSDVAAEILICLSIFEWKQWIIFHQIENDQDGDFCPASCNDFMFDMIHLIMLHGNHETYISVNMKLCKNEIFISINHRLKKTEDRRLRSKWVEMFPSFDIWTR